VLSLPLSVIMATTGNVRLVATREFVPDGTGSGPRARANVPGGSIAFASSGPIAPEVRSSDLQSSIFSRY
jgi:hypothetical protein